MVDKIDSNVTGGFITQENSLGVLPAAASQTWRTLEPNSWASFGGKLSTVARTPINDGRKRYKGAITGLEAAAGFQSDLTMSNLGWLMQGFTFANAREAAKTAPYNSAAIAITSVATADDSFNAASGLNVFATNMLVKAEGFTNSANNGVHVVTTGGVAAKLIVSTNLTIEASPPAASKLTAVGYQYPSADLALTVNGTEVVLTSATIAPSVLGIAVGQWVFVGDGADTNAHRYTNAAPFFARVKALNNTARTITLDRPTGTVAADTGTGKTIRVYFGTSVYDEPLSANIVRRSYTIERTLGSDGIGVQSEHVTGAVPNEITFNVETANKITADLTFACMDHDTRTGTEGALKAQSGTTVLAAPAEDAINTTSHVYAQRVSLYSATPAMTALVGYCSSAKFTVKNNVKPCTAIGVLGGFDVTAGVFEVSGSVDAYFGTVAAQESVRDYDTVAYDLILTQGNKGIVIDLPHVGLGNGELNVSPNEPVKLPLDTDAFVSAQGYTFGMTSFDYLPDAAM